MNACGEWYRRRAPAGEIGLSVMELDSTAPAGSPLKKSRFVISGAMGGLPALVWQRFGKGGRAAHGTLSLFQRAVSGTRRLIGLAAVSALIGVLVFPAPAVSGSRELTGLIATAVAGQKSVLDDFDDKEEKPLGESPRDESSPDAGPMDAAGKENLDDQHRPGAAEYVEFHDVVFWRDNGSSRVRDFPAAPFQRYLGRQLSQKDASEKFRIRRFSEGEGKTYFNLNGSQIVKIRYYEEIMGEAAAEKVGCTFDELVGHENVVELLSDGIEFAQRAEKTLDTAIAEHDSAVQRGVRAGPAWRTELRAPLVRARTNLRLGKVDLLTDDAELQRAEMECDRLLATLDDDPRLLDKVFQRLERIFTIRAKAASDREDYVTIRELLYDLEGKCPGRSGAGSSAVRDELIAKARQAADEAESLKETSPREALQKLEEALVIWPALGRVEELRRQFIEDYPILHCAYHEIPNHPTPMTARSAVDRHAVSLIFESLVRWVDDPRMGAHYRRELAAGPPIPLARGRRFQLQRAGWSDSQDDLVRFCTVEDVRQTLAVLCNSECPGYSHAWSDLLRGIDNREDNDPLAVLLRLKRDYWQPLSLMDFEILPAHRFAGAGAASDLRRTVRLFDRQPAGTGPFRLAERDGNHPDVVRFVANRHYRTPGLPRIREVNFHRLDGVEAVRRFQDDEDEMHLIFGLRKEHVSLLRKSGKRVEVLRTPTVSFLAPNYRVEKMRNENLRLAIAHAIDRPEILQQYFRPGAGAEEHRALTGPYPADSWANNPEVTDFNQAMAKAYAELARQELSATKLEIRLAYPAGKPNVERACERIKTNVADRTGILLELTPVDAWKFYDQIVIYHDFELAYWNHSYKDSTYWIEPLLDADRSAHEPGGLNFMGYTPDREMATFFRDVRLHKQFRTIQSITHKIHEHVARKAIVIPLWQLDTYIALSDRLKNVTLDPFIPYANIEEWEIRAESTR